MTGRLVDPVLVRDERFDQAHPTGDEMAGEVLQGVAEPVDITCVRDGTEETSEDVVEPSGRKAAHVREVEADARVPSSRDAQHRFAGVHSFALEVPAQMLHMQSRAAGDIEQHAGIRPNRAHDLCEPCRLRGVGTLGRIQGIVELGRFTERWCPRVVGVVDGGITHSAARSARTRSNVNRPANSTRKTPNSEVIINFVFTV